MGRTSGTGCCGGGTGYTIPNIPRPGSRNLEQVDHLLIGCDGKSITVTAPEGFIISKDGEERLIKMPVNGAAASSRHRLNCLKPKTFEDFRQEHEAAKIRLAKASATKQV